MKNSVDLLFLVFATNVSGEISKLFKNPSLLSSASARLQVIPMMNAAHTINWTTSIWSLHSEKPEDLQDIASLKQVKGVIVGKMSSNKTHLINSMIMANSAAIFYLKSKGVPITVLYSDNHISRDDEIGLFYRSILSYANTIIVPSHSLEKEVNNYTDGKIKVHVIKDPWQTPELPFNKTDCIKKKVNLIWFGSGRNIDYLIEVMPKILRECKAACHYNIKILARGEMINHFKNAMPSSVPTKKKWTIDYIKWNDMDQPSQFHRALADSHVSIIPSNPKDPSKLGVSHNRLVDSVRSGCITVASPLNSYLELEKIAILGDDFPGMIDSAIANYSSLCEKFEEVREGLLSEFNPELNAKSWNKLVSLEINKKTL